MTELNENDTNRNDASRNDTTQNDMNVKSLRKRKVVDISTAETIGRVKSVQINTGGPTVSGITMKGRGSGRIDHTDVISYGPDAVTVRDASVVVDDDGSLPDDADAIGSTLLDENGRRLGKVEDLTMGQDGSVVAVTADGQTHRRRLLGIGSYAVVISRS